MAHADWTVKSLDIMSRTKDTMRGQLSTNAMTTICNNLAQLGARQIAVSCPLDFYTAYPAPQPTNGYLDNWVAAIRASGCNVFFRGSWINFEAIYDAPKRTPTSAAPIALGAATTVLNGTDTTSYLSKTWNFIKTHGALFAAGDIWGPCPEPESQGIGGATSDMFSSYSVMGQWLVDQKTVADNAFQNTLGYSAGQIVTGMTSINGGTVQFNQIGSSYWSQIGRCSIDHYVPLNQYYTDLDTIHTNAGVDIYINEWGPTAGFGGSLNDSNRFDSIFKAYKVFSDKSYIKGLNYWQATSGTDAFENIIDHATYAPKQSARVIEKYYKNTARIRVN